MDLIFIQGFGTGWFMPIQKGTIISVKQVRDELMEREDRLSLWCKNKKSMFVDTNDTETYESMKILSPWVCQNYLPAAQAKFLDAQTSFGCLCPCP